MDSNGVLKDKVILVVDDEPDILETLAEELDMCLVHKAADYDTALQFLLSYTYDVVILDIMGVNGFELLKTSVSRTGCSLFPSHGRNIETEIIAWRCGSRWWQTHLAKSVS